jgi:Protein of unknown function (DUF5672)
MSKITAIVIPIYKQEMSSSERVSFERALKVFPENDIIIVSPKSLNLDNYLALSPTLKVNTFDDYFFENITGYNELMLSVGFYERFLNYKYILIYQLDAYVFENQLNYWEKANYDYVGSPWLIPPPIASNKKPKVNIQHWFVNRVGNGGLSLRKVKTHYWTMIFYWILIKFFPLNEDMFLGILMDFINPFFKKPKAMEALKFAFEMQPRKSFELNNHQLPFGVHAWEKYDPEFWKEFIPS